MHLRPGRELDELIAEKVMGYSMCEKPWPNSTEIYRSWVSPEGMHAGFDLPHYSTDIAAAWRVVEELSPKIIVGPSPWVLGKYVATWGACDSYADCFDWLEADTAPHAICLAALKAVEGA